MVCDVMQNWQLTLICCFLDYCVRPYDWDIKWYLSGIRNNIPNILYLLYLHNNFMCLAMYWGKLFFVENVRYDNNTQFNTPFLIMRLVLLQMKNLYGTVECLCNSYNLCV